MAGAGPSPRSRQIFFGGSWISEDGTGPVVPGVASNPSLWPFSVTYFCPEAPVLTGPRWVDDMCPMQLLARPCTQWPWC